MDKKEIEEMKKNLHLLSSDRLRNIVKRYYAYIDNPVDEKEHDEIQKEINSLPGWEMVEILPYFVGKEGFQNMMEQANSFDRHAEEQIQLFTITVYKELQKTHNIIIANDDDLREAFQSGKITTEDYEKAERSVIQKRDAGLIPGLEPRNGKYKEGLMAKVEILKRGITSLNVDAVVNAANEQLLMGGGVCNAIFKGAGVQALTDACQKIGYCPTGQAVATPAFDLHSEYIIHAVGPVWKGGKSNESRYLYSAYFKSLDIARRLDCHSIAFPLISSGIFGYPKKEAWSVALRACAEWLDINQDYDLDIYFTVIDDDVFSMGEMMLKDIAKEFDSK